METTKSCTAQEQPHEVEDIRSSETSACTFQSIEHAALAYAEAGLSVMPVKQDKYPALSTWMELKTSRPSVDIIRQWYASGTLGVGIICGNVSGNLECLDVDEKYNSDTTPLLDQLNPLVDALASGLLSRLVHEESQNGGHHFVYRSTTIEGSRSLARRYATVQELEKKPKEKTKVLIETRGEGGYFVSYPSPGYRLISGSFTDIPQITEDERKVLFDCARALNQRNEEETTVSGYPTKRRTSIVRPGDDFNLRGDIATRLSEEGWRLCYTNKGVEYWTRPGKASGVSATFNKHPLHQRFRCLAVTR